MIITCPECGATKKTSPAHAKRWKSFVCRECINKKRKAARRIQCPLCHKWRECKPSIIQRLASHACRECIEKKNADAWLETTCPKCGRTRKIPPYEIAKKERRGLHHSGYCRTCSKVYDLTIPDTWDAGYVVGVILGDGYMHKAHNGEGWFYCLILRVTSEAFARKFREIFARLRGRSVWISSKRRHLKGNPSIRMPPCDIVEWSVGATDRGWYERLESFKKQREFGPIMGFSKEFKLGFLHGMVDSEGYDGGRFADVANKDIELLKTVVACAKELGFSASIRGPYEYSRGVAHAYIGYAFHKTQ